VSVLLGLVGRKLGHSASPKMFAAVLPMVRPGAEYVSWEVEPGQLADHVASLRALGARGFNVTVPYKEAIVPLLDALEGDASTISAVNCVCNEDGRFVGRNTDAAAFEASLLVALLSAGQGLPRSALVLGAGGAAKAVVLALGRIGVAKILVAARRKASVTEDAFLSLHAGYVPWSPTALSETALASAVVVNATPVGMHPDIDSSPLSSGFRPGQLVFDLVYNPRPTLFLRQAATAGAQTADGLDMLARQAAEALQLWTGAVVHHATFATAVPAVNTSPSAAA